MNILYIHTHDTGRYIQPYGYPVPTPNLMNFSSQGVLFRQAFSMAPTCSPSRASLLTGQTPHESGMLGLTHRGFTLHDYNKHLVRFLKKHGFETILAGIQHVAPDPEMIGYDVVLSKEKPDMRAVGYDSISFDRNNAEQVVEYFKGGKKRPFFISYGLFNTHREFPHLEDSDISPDYVLPPFPLYDSPQTRADMAGFIKSAKVMDECVGKVLKALKKADLDKDTMVIFTTDHGIPFPKMKCHLYDMGIGVSLIIKIPGSFNSGTISDALVSQIDIFPTICDMLGVEKPSWLRGTSFKALLEGKIDRIRDEIFAEVTFHAAYEPMRCIRTERYKYIKFFDDHEDIIPVNIDDGISKDFLIEHGLLETRRDKEMLFDLFLDRIERVNLIHDTRYGQTYRDLKNRLKQWMKETKDPLHKGKIEKPAGAIINKRSCISHKKDNDFE